MKILFLIFLFAAVALSQTTYPLIAVKGEYAVINTPQYTKLKIGLGLKVFRKAESREIFICYAQIDKSVKKYFRLKLFKTLVRKAAKKGDYVKI